MTYYVLTKGGQVLGPYTLLAMAELVSAGNLGSTITTETPEGAGG
jgi:hypothetical protein